MNGYPGFEAGRGGKYHLTDYNYEYILKTTMALSISKFDEAYYGKNA